ncbi:hypothetical protein Tco_0154831 [Tanacetum coccineum]
MVFTRSSNNGVQEQDAALTQSTTFATKEINKLNNGEGTSHRGGNNGNGQYGRLTKLEFPKFHGEDVKEIKKRYRPRHKCSGEMYCLEVIASDEMIDEDQDNVLAEQEIVSVIENKEEIMPQISLNALTGVNNYQKMSIRGYPTVIITIDAGQADA